MGRVIGIDYGSKRVGIAVTDPLRMIASGLTTVHSQDVLAYLDQYMREETVDCIVVGEPRQMDGSPSQSAELIDNFVRHLKRRYKELAIERTDERFTSSMAMQAMIDGGLKKKARQNKEMVDQVSATLILQSWMEAQKYRT